MWWYWVSDLELASYPTHKSPVSLHSVQVQQEQEDGIAHQTLQQLFRSDRLHGVLSRLVDPDHPLLPLILRHPSRERNIRSTFHCDQARGWQCLFFLASCSWMLENNRADFNRLAWVLFISLVDYKRKVLVDKDTTHDVWKYKQFISAIIHHNFLIFRLWILSAQ